MYEETTRDITVSVTPQFDPLRSEPDRSQYFWLYTIDIANGSNAAVQLLTRHWIITDSAGRREEVRGKGVVGETPVLEPGERFNYTSGCPLTSPSGFMVGTFGMVDADGQPFTVNIPAFSLDTPGAMSRFN